MISRSNWAIDPSTFNINFAVGVDVSIFMLLMRSAAPLPAMWFSIAHSSATERARRSSFVTMRDNPLTDKIQRTVKLGQLSHTQNLLHEDLIAPFTLQLFDLGIV